MAFHLGVDYRPRGDQAAAIEQLFRGLLDGEKHQTLLGVTGFGKTYTMAQLIEKNRAAGPWYSPSKKHWSRPIAPSPFGQRAMKGEGQANRLARWYYEGEEFAL
jgi:hypothetical protein